MDKVALVTGVGPERAAPSPDGFTKGAIALLLWRATLLGWID